jgi:hypothetical protein
MTDLWKHFSAEVKSSGRRSLGFLAAIPATALPRRYRLRYTDASDSDLLSAALASGFIQLAVFGIAYILLFLSRLGSYRVFPLLEYAVDIRSIPIGYLAVEGAARFLSAHGSHEVLPSLPFVVIERIGSYFDRRREALRVGPRVPDRVTRGDGKACDWCVECWAAKLDWDRNKYLMISFRGTYYEVVGRETREPPRPHTYLLKEPPSWKLVVKPEIYDPDESG